METETILAELNRINDRLDSIEQTINDIRLDIAILRKAEIKERPDKYKTWPTEDDLDAEEEKELEEAKNMASPEWHTINSLENIINTYKKNTLLRK